MAPNFTTSTGWIVEKRPAGALGTAPAALAIGLSLAIGAKTTMTYQTFCTEPITAEKRWAFPRGARLLLHQCNEPVWEEHLENLREARNPWK